MPKQVDHQARRNDLLQALMRITRREGWDAISLRKVAAEAGVSMGMVQHYFTTKDEMLRFAIEMMDDDVRQRIRARVAELPQPITPRVLVGTVLTEMIPRASRREAETDGAKVWIRRFMLRPESSAVLTKGATEVRTALIDQIRLACPAKPQVEVERDAGTLMALLDGLMLAIVSGQQTAESATDILNAHLDHVFSAPGQGSGR